MTSFAISPDLRGVLEDIAAQPKQRLFAGTFFRRMHEAFRGEDATVGIAQAGLSTAERHLVAMHRRELGRVLLEGWYATFLRPGGPGGLLRPSRELPCAEEWGERARFARDSAPSRAFSHGSSAWLHRLLEGRTPESYLDFQSLLTAALRLHNSPIARLYAGIVQTRFGFDRAALGSWQSLLYRCPSEVRLAAQQMTRDVWAGLGMADRATEMQRLLLDQAVGAGSHSGQVEVLTAGEYLKAVHGADLNVHVLATMVDGAVLDEAEAQVQARLPELCAYHDINGEVCERLDSLKRLGVSWGSS